MQLNSLVEEIQESTVNLMNRSEQSLDRTLTVRKGRDLHRWRCRRSYTFDEATGSALCSAGGRVRLSNLSIDQAGAVARSACLSTQGAATPAGNGAQAWHGVRSRARHAACCFRSSACTECDFTASFTACTIMHASVDAASLHAAAAAAARRAHHHRIHPSIHPSICVHACSCPPLD
jgi:hypothetical protein